MKEKDKGWHQSAKLQAALVAGVVVLAIWLTNPHDAAVLDKVLGICELVICAAVGGHVGMSITQMLADRNTDETYRVDPKDADDPEIP